MLRARTAGAMAALVLLAHGAPGRADEGEWETDATFGVAILTYPTASAPPVAALSRTPPRAMLPMPSGGCRDCVSSVGPGGSLSVAHWLGRVLRAVVSFDASQHPEFDVGLHSGAAGLGVGTKMGSLPLFAHGDVLLGMYRIDGAVDQTSVGIQIVIGLD